MAATQLLQRLVRNGSLQRSIGAPRRRCSEYIEIPLSEPLPNISTPKRASSHHKKPAGTITRLPNGVKVVSAPCYGQISVVGVAVAAGSRYEKSFPKGVSHLMSKMAFESSRKVASKETLLESLEHYGATAHCEMQRDCGIYSVLTFREGVKETIAAVADTVLYPKFLTEEVQAQKDTVQFELEHMDMMADQEIILTEMIHEAAFGHNNVGISKFCDERAIAGLDEVVLRNYLETLYTPERLVLGGVGMEHEELVELGKTYFQNDVPEWFKSPKSRLEEDIAKYLGGSNIVNMDKAPASPTLTEAQMPELSHAVFGLQAVSYFDPDFFALAVLSVLMGGGGSFSAGGPGKGMYSRLYRNVLGQHHWLFSCSCMHFSYADSGLFVISASAPPERMDSLAEVVIAAICKMKEGFSNEEISRAKRQLQSILLMNMESRSIIFEDICRQTLAMGEHMPPETICDKIERITEEDLLRLVDRMLNSKLSVAAYGNLTRFPSYDELISSMKYGQTKPRRQLFY